MTDTAIFAFTRADDDVVDIRTATIDGASWFAAPDFCRALGLKPDHTSKVAHMFGEGEVRTLHRKEALSDGACSADFFTGSSPRVRLLSESGL